MLIIRFVLVFFSFIVTAPSYAKFSLEETQKALSAMRQVAGSPPEPIRIAPAEGLAHACTVIMEDPQTKADTLALFQQVRTDILSQVSITDLMLRLETFWKTRAYWPYPYRFLVEVYYGGLLRDSSPDVQEFYAIYILGHVPPGSPLPDKVRIVLEAQGWSHADIESLLQRDPVDSKFFNIVRSF